MEIKVGSVVYSKSGRDAGSFLAVVGFRKREFFSVTESKDPLQGRRRKT